MTGPVTPALNQCDGCRRGLPLNEHGNHYNPDGSYDRIGCTADRYAAPARADAAATPGAGRRTNRPPPGTLVTCEFCPTPHVIDDDGTRCKFPRTVSPQPGATPGERDGAGRPEAPCETVVASSSCGACSAMREALELADTILAAATQGLYDEIATRNTLNIVRRALGVLR